MTDQIQRWDDNTVQALRYIGIVERNGWEGENLLPSCITLRAALQSAAAHEAAAVAAVESEWVRDAHQMSAAAYQRGQRDAEARIVKAAKEFPEYRTSAGEVLRAFVAVIDAGEAS